jgi:hypothetical protein
MMKDQGVIDKVITDQKCRTTSAFLKFYQLLKSLRREKLSISVSDKSGQNVSKGPSKGFIDLIISLCRDSFNLLGGSVGYLNARQVQKYSELLGKSLDEEQLYFFLKKCQQVKAKSEASSGQSLSGKVEPNFSPLYEGKFRFQINC